jgi:Cu-Zn family superoxide dismutase
MFISQRIGSSVISGLLATSVILGGGAVALAQDASPAATPEAAPVEEEAPPLKAQLTLTNVEGEPVGFAAIEEVEGGVTVTVANSDDSGLEPGEHGIHIHETGICDPAGDEPFSTAGGHFNPTDEAHGGPDTDPRHAGDLGNLMVEEDGSFVFEVTVEGPSLGEGTENTLADEDGSALVIHANPDDLETDPSGESGGRQACGVIFPTTLATASPMASPEATPAS